MDRITAWRNVWHRESNIKQFPDVKLYSSLDHAKAALPDDSNAFIISFTLDGRCDRLWFSPEQRENGMADRIDNFRSCYGTYSIETYQPLEVAA